MCCQSLAAPVKLSDTRGGGARRARPWMILWKFPRGASLVVCLEHDVTLTPTPVQNSGKPKGVPTRLGHRQTATQQRESKDGCITHCYPSLEIKQTDSCLPFAVAEKRIKQKKEKVEQPFNESAGDARRDSDESTIGVIFRFFLEQRQRFQQKSYMEHREKCVPTGDVRGAIIRRGNKTMTHNLR